MASRIRISARLRPFLPGELEDDAVTVQQEADGSGCIMVVQPQDKAQWNKFSFSSCYGFDSTQEHLYNKDVKPLIDIVYNGVVVTVFAYGVTSSGKTHTVQGTRSEPGIIPRVIKDLFERKTAVTSYEVNISVSYMEIYKDDVYDLLVGRESATKLPIRESHGQVFVANLSSHLLKDAKEFESIYSAASKRRSTGATKLNRASSRSHAILTFTVDVIDRGSNEIMTGKMKLVDLAGSENNKLTGNGTSRMAESAAINKSLSVLGQVVHALNEGAPRIPYRDSKLTRILQDALGGSAVGLLICNLAPGLKFRQDTMNSLNFANRTKEIVNRPTVNVQDKQPLQKAHFAALTPPAPTLPLANITDVPPQRESGRPSLVPIPGPSRLPAPKGGRLSSVGFQTFSSLGNTGAPQTAPSETGSSRNSGTLGVGLTQEELDERISKAVEAEVARRLAEKEREREHQEAEARRQAEASNASASVDGAVPSGMLTPILKRHQDLDDELSRRLRELEEKYERGTKDKDDAEVMSPVSKKKLGRAYVALARSHSEKGNLQLALDFYKKAELYVPGNVKLKERIIEIDWSIKHNTKYIPEPKKKKQGKDKQSKKSKASHGTEEIDDGSVMKAPLGEATNTEMTATSPQAHKRTRSRNLAGTDVDVEMMQTPAKKPRCKGVGVVEVNSDDECELLLEDEQTRAPARRTRARAEAEKKEARGLTIYKVALD